MRYRISIILVTVMAIFGFSAPGAFASTDQLMPIPCTLLEGATYHVMTNDNATVGIDYQGVGNLTKVTTSPGDSHFTCVSSSSDFLDIHNNAGNCIRMRDASNHFDMIEESSCQPGNANYQFLAYFNPSNNRYEFQNVNTELFLGVTCPAEPGSQVRGVAPLSGACLNWILEQT